jgi:hypothetical protein
MELGLLVNMKKIQAQQELGMAQAISAAFSAEAFASLAERAGVSERVVNKLRMQSSQNNIQSTQGLGQWQ